MFRARQKIAVVNRTRGTVLGDDIAVADNTYSRVVGLLGKRSLARGSGLLIAPSQGVHTFGMMFSIDVVFLDANSRVLSVRSELKPFRLSKVIWKARSVLELPAGAVRASRTGIGDELHITELTT
jgi:uncharacterized membrane protein (UPF0127 family)